MEIFQKVDSVFEFIITDPILFFQHILYNVFVNLPIKLASSITFSDNLILPQGFYYLEYAFQLVVIGLITFFILVFIYKKKYFKIGFLKQQLFINYKPLIVLFGFLITPSISLILVFPNEWYLITIIYMLLSFIGIVFFTNDKVKKIPILWFCLACFILILITPVQKKYKTMLFETTIEERKEM